MAAYLGDFDAADMVDLKFTTINTSGAPTQLAGTPAISIYKDNSTTQSTTGVTLTVDFDSVTGMNHVRIDTSADGSFYAAGSDFQVVITTGTVGGTSVVGYVVGYFSIRNRANLYPTTAGRTLDVSAGGEAGVDWANVGTPGSTVSLSATTVATVTTATTATNVTTVNGLAANVITAASIATDAIDADAIADNAINAAAIATGAITAAKFAAGAIDAAAIADGAIDAATFAAGAITATVIATGAIDADAIASDAATEIRSLASGTSDSGTTTTMVDAARTEADTDYWKGMLIVFTSGNIAGQARVITAFDAATDTITFAPATTQAVSTQTYEIWPVGDYLRPTTTGRTLDVSSGGEAGVDWANVGTPGSTVNLSATTVNLVNTLTTYTGNTPQTGDAFARLGAPAGASVSADILTIDNLVDDLESRVGTPSNLGSGATVAANLVDIESQTDDIGTAGAGLTAVPWNASWDAEVQSEVQDAIEVNHLDHLIAVADPGSVVANSSFLAKLVSKSATPAFSSYDNTTDSLEAIRDRGDAAWITATGFSTHTAADVWAAGTRTLTAATNITSTGGTITVSSGAITVGTNNDKTGYTLSAAGISAALTTQMTESYNTDGTAPTPAQAFFVIMQILTEMSISGTTMTVKKIDGSTTAYTCTLDSATTPTSITRAT